MTSTTFIIELKEFNKAETTIFISILWEINLRGLKILNNRKILMNVKSVPVSI